MSIRRLLLGAGAGIRGELGRELFIGGLGAGSMRVAEMVLGLASAILLARQLGATGIGIYSLALATVTLAALPIESGLPALVVRETARASAKQDWDGVRAVLSFATRAIILVAVVLGVAAVLFLPLLLDRYPAEQIKTLAAAVAIPLLSALSNVCAAALRGLRRPLLGTAAELLIRPGAVVLFLGGTAVLVPGWLTPARAAMLTSAAAGCGLAFAAVSLAWHAPRRTSSRKLPMQLSIWVGAAFRLGVIRGMRVAQGQLLLLIVGVLGSADTAGLLRIAQRGATVAGFGYNTIVILISPYLVQLDSQGDRARMQRLITASARAMTISTLIPFAVFLFAGRPLLNLLFGPEFAAAQLALVALSLGFLLVCVLGPAATLIQMLNREHVLLAALGASLLTTTLLAAALTGPFGAAGAAAAGSTGLVLNQLILWHMADRIFGLRTSVFGR